MIARLGEVLSHYAPQFVHAGEGSPQEFRGFSGATVWRVEAPAGEFALRCWGRPSPARARLSELHRLLRFLGQRCEFVAVPVQASDGDSLVEHDQRFWQLDPWLPGEADFWGNPAPERLRNAMHALARWHEAARLFPTTVESREFRCEDAGTSPGVVSRLQRLHQWQRGKLLRLRRAVSLDNIGGLWPSLAHRVMSHFDRVAHGLTHELEAAMLLAVPLQPCLRDIWHDHVLFEADTVTGLIDPAACRTESVAADLARLLGSLIGDDSQARESALQAYDEGRSLCPRELQLVPILDSSGLLLSGLTWLDRYYLQNRSFPDVEAVLARVNRIVARLDFQSP